MTGKYWLSFLELLKKDILNYTSLSLQLQIFCLCVIRERLNFALIESYKRENVIMRCLFFLHQLCEANISSSFNNTINDCFFGAALKAALI